MKSSSIEMVKQGINSPREYRDKIIHDWYLEHETANRLFLYVLRETTPEEFYSHTNDAELLIGGRTYSIVYISKPTQVRKAKHILVSLRYCTYLERGYALVKTLNGGRFDKLEY